MQYPICRHIKTNGLQCQAPSMRQDQFCYFHTRLHNRHRSFRHSHVTAGYLVPGQHIELNTLEDHESVQLAVSVVVNALATGQLETRRATALLYGLQVASMNARSLTAQPSDVVLSSQPSAEGLDLAEPGAVLELGKEIEEEDPEENPQDVSPDLAAC